MIHICYGLHDKDGRYSKFTGASIVSIFENSTAPPRFIAVHILHDNTLSQENRDKFNQIAGRYGQIIKFYNVEEICPDKIEEIKKAMSKAEMFERFSIGTSFRLLMADVLEEDIEKVIYLDSDIIVNMDVNELWQIDMENKPLASVSSWDLGLNHVDFYREHYLATSGILGYKEYFCSAFLVADLNYWRSHKEKILESINFVAENTNCNYFDQDVLNYWLAKNYVHLDEKFDVFVVFERRDEIKRSKLRPAIYHYVSQSLGLNTQDIFNRLWFKYFSKTPWFDEEIFSHIYEGVQQIYIWQKNFLTQVSAIQANKSRAFFVASQNIPAVKQIFAVKESEEIIELVSDESIQNLIQSIKKSSL